MSTKLLKSNRRFSPQLVPSPGNKSNELKLSQLLTSDYPVAHGHWRRVHHRNLGGKSEERQRALVPRSNENQQDM